mmetsp:Transcript_20010/g.41847  ORF Transcript_20010/g.41847 Transcript_20010/m.41847 type:complete len:183 (-) Transcript_20010:17-565(-)
MYASRRLALSARSMNRLSITRNMRPLGYSTEQECSNLASTSVLTRSSRERCMPCVSRRMLSSDSSSNDVPLFPDVPGAEKGGKKLAIVYTCKVCNTRSAKRFTENAYLNGVVLVRCPGCENLHLIADRLGFFEDREGGGWDVEKFLKEKGEDVTAVHEGNVLEVRVSGERSGGCERSEDSDC